jgi:hypothetical protein
MRVQKTPEDMATPNVDILQQHISPQILWQEAHIELNKLGDTTPAPYNYRYDQIERNNSEKYPYIIHTSYHSCIVYLSREISPSYTYQKHHEHRELMAHLDRYFGLKDTIDEIQQELKRL